MHINCWTVCHGFDALSLNLLYFQLAEADNDSRLNLTQIYGHLIDTLSMKLGRINIGLR